VCGPRAKEGQGPLCLPAGESKRRGLKNGGKTTGRAKGRAGPPCPTWECRGGGGLFDSSGVVRFGRVGGVVSVSTYFLCFYLRGCSAGSQLSPRPGFFSRRRGPGMEGGQGGGAGRIFDFFAYFRRRGGSRWGAGGGGAAFLFSGGGPVLSLSQEGSWPLGGGIRRRWCKKSRGWAHRRALGILLAWGRAGGPVRPGLSPLRSPPPGVGAGVFLFLPLPPPPASR